MTFTESKYEGVGVTTSPLWHALSVWTSGKSVDAKTDDRDCANLKVHSDGTVADTPEVNLFGRLDLTHWQAFYKIKIKN